MKKRILAIEDEREILHVMRVRLEANGYEVLEALDGEEGLRKARKESPDLILLDLVLPKKGGAEILAELKEDPAYKHIPIIVVTGLSQDVHGVRETVAKADAYFLKPFDYVELLATMADVLKNTQSEE